MQTVFEEDIKGLKEFINKARNKELRFLDVLQFSVFTLILFAALISISGFGLYLGLTLISIYFIIITAVFALLFMKKDFEEYAKLISLIIGITIGDITMEFYDWYTGWEHDPTRVPWLEMWEDPGFYLGGLVTAITAIIIYKSIKKFYGGRKVRVFTLILTIAILCAVIYTPQVYAQANSTAANSTEDASIIDKLTYGKSGWKHLAIWSEALLTSYGAKIVGKIVRYFKPDVDPSLFEKGTGITLTIRELRKTYRDGSLESWGVFLGTNALTLGKTAAKRLPMAVVIEESG